MMERKYIELVRLLIDAAPSVFDGSPFALKGGTAINLFVAEMPRLSIDLDLVFTDHRVGRKEALRSIAEALAITRDRLRREGLEVDLVANEIIEDIANRIEISGSIHLRGELHDDINVAILVVVTSSH